MPSALFSSQSRRDAEAVVSRFFEPHSLSLADGRVVDFHFGCLQLSDAVTLSRLRYGTRVTIETERFSRDIMVSMPLSGWNDVRLPGNEFHLDSDSYSVVMPGQALRQERSENCEMLILRICADRVQEYVKSRVGFNPRGPLSFAQPPPYRGDSGRRLRRLATFLLDDLDGSPAIGSTRFHYEQALIGTILGEHANSYSPLLESGSDGPVAKYVYLAEEFIRGSPGAKITTELLASQQNANVRTLQLAFKRFRGCSPMQMVKSIRLELVHSELQSQAAASDTVTNIAMKYGFMHLGSFAQDYRARYGETPSVTRRKAH